MTWSISAPLPDELEVGELSVLFEEEDPETILAWALDRFGPGFGLVTSFQAEGLVLLDLAVRLDPDVRVLTVDPGRLPEKSVAYIDTIRRHFDVDVEIFRPGTAEVEAMVRKHGPDLFRESVRSRLLCCHVRKVRPLVSALSGLSAWATGLRRDQWASRAGIAKIELDHDHGGIVKLNPLADWTHEDVEAHLERYGIPRHPLIARGYTSLGCAPCTRATRPAEDPRAGRWWWEKDAPKECGMHCSLESGSFEHEVEELIGATSDRDLEAEGEA